MGFNVGMNLLKRNRITIMSLHTNVVIMTCFMENGLIMVMAMNIPNGLRIFTIPHQGGIMGH
jgi:hypothetical protein